MIYVRLFLIEFYIAILTVFINPPTSIFNFHLLEL